MKTRAAVILSALAVSLTGCSQGGEPAADLTPQGSQSIDSEELSSEHRKVVNEYALMMEWEDLTYAEQDSICVGWNLDRDLMIEFVNQSLLDLPTIDGPMVIDFFDRQCRNWPM